MLLVASLEVLVSNHFALLIMRKHLLDIVEIMAVFIEGRRGIGSRLANLDALVRWSSLCPLEP